MKGTSKMGPALQTVLGKMCSMVGATPAKIDFQAPTWYWKYQWTQAQELEFRQWLIDYLRVDRAARHELVRSPTANKTRLARAADEFIFMYSWKVLDPGGIPAKDESPARTRPRAKRGSRSRRAD